jgi:hypothetical protein
MLDLIMKKYFGIITTLVISVFLFTAQVSAASTVNTDLRHAYPKGNNTYDVIVKNVSNSKLALYINDKNPVYATTNKQGWATFHKVKIVNTGKVSFAEVLGSKNKTYQKPINYVRYYKANSGAVAFQASNPARQPVKPQVSPVAPAPIAKTVAPPAPVPQPQPIPEPTPQPTCANGSYVNSVGNTVCSPAASPSAPAGATAQCADGTFSFSQSRSGTCSHHGGVGQWL